MSYCTICGNEYLETTDTYPFQHCNKCRNEVKIVTREVPMNNTGETKYVISEHKYNKGMNALDRAINMKVELTVGDLAKEDITYELKLKLILDAYERMLKELNTAFDELNINVDYKK